MEFDVGNVVKVVSASITSKKKYGKSYCDSLKISKGTDKKLLSITHRILKKRKSGESLENFEHLLALKYYLCTEMSSNGMYTN